MPEPAAHALPSFPQFRRSRRLSGARQGAIKVLHRLTQPGGQGIAVGAVTELLGMDGEIVVLCLPGP